MSVSMPYGALFDAKTGEYLTSFTEHDFQIISIAASPTKPLALTSSVGGPLRLWEWSATGK